MYTLLQIKYTHILKSIFPHVLDGQDCRQDQGYDGIKGVSGNSWAGGDMCHEYSSCEHDKSVGMFKCKCKEGLEGDGFQCHAVKGFDLN